MQKPPIKKVLALALGGFVGLLNGLLGMGGGMVAVPLLRSMGLSERESHATSILLILLLSVVSVGSYLFSGNFHFTDALPFLPGGALGAIIGAVLLKKLPLRLIRLLFSVLVLISAVRLLF